MIPRLVPVEHLTRDRQVLLDELTDLPHVQRKESSMVEVRLPAELLPRLRFALRQCPRSNCATCDHMAKSEQSKQQETTTGD